MNIWRFNLHIEDSSCTLRIHRGLLKFILKLILQIKHSTYDWNMQHSLWKFSSPCKQLTSDLGLLNSERLWIFAELGEKRDWELNFTDTEKQTDRQIYKRTGRKQTTTRGQYRKCFPSDLWKKENPLMFMQAFFLI